MLVIISQTFLIVNTFLKLHLFVFVLLFLAIICVNRVIGRLLFLNEIKKGVDLQLKKLYNMIKFYEKIKVKSIK